MYNMGFYEPLRYIHRQQSGERMVLWLQAAQGHTPTPLLDLPWHAHRNSAFGGSSMCDCFGVTVTLHHGWISGTSLNTVFVAH